MGRETVAGLGVLPKGAELGMKVLLFTMQSARLLPAMQEQASEPASQALATQLPAAHCSPAARGWGGCSCCGARRWRTTNWPPIWRARSAAATLAQPLKTGVRLRTAGLGWARLRPEEPPDLAGAAGALGVEQLPWLGVRSSSGSSSMSRSSAAGAGRQGEMGAGVGFGRSGQRAAGCLAKSSVSSSSVTGTLSWHRIARLRRCTGTGALAWRRREVRHGAALTVAGRQREAALLGAGGGQLWPGVHPGGRPR